MERKPDGKPRTKFDFGFLRTRDWKYYEVYLERFRNNPSPILEMGSGIGLFLLACKMNGIEAVGVEYEQEGVEETLKRGLIARQHDLGYPLDFFEDESFGAVFSNQVIEHLSKEAQRNMVQEAFRLLKAGGQLLIISPCRHWEPARADKYHINLLTPSELKVLVESAGFIDCNMGYNRPQEIPEIPEEKVQELWREYQPDLFSKDATVLACKPK